jgi:hypothetical protein
MLLTDLWKEKMKNVLQMTYNNNLNEKTIDKILDEKIKESLNTKRVLRLRNVYQGTLFDIEFNEILNYIYDNKLNIGANGALSESYHTMPSDISQLLIEDMEGRKIEKNLAKQYEKEGKLKEAAMHDTLQTKLKQDTNSVYGVQCQSGSFLYNPDSASFITYQCQQLIAEMMWSFEKFFAGNIQLKSYNEAMLYFYNIINFENQYEKFSHYLSYIPTQEDLEKRLLWILSEMPNFTSKTHQIEKSLFYFIKTRTEKERIYLYYKNNLKEFLIRNPAIQKLFRNILEKEDQFLNPYDIPKIYEDTIKEIFAVLSEFVAFYDMTYNRVTKYKTCYRDAVVLSDTDSIYISYNNIMDIIKILCKSSINPNTSENDLNFKLVNTLASISSFYVEKMLEEFMFSCNAEVPVEKYKINMKNEYYFRNLLLYTGVKKNYSGYVLLREGNLVPEKKQIAETGIKLTSSRIPNDITVFQSELIKNFILKVPVINPVLILNEINKMKQKLIAGLKEGRKAYGIPVRFSGVDAYKNADQMQQVRLAEIWNRLYPLDPVLPGDTMMTFETKVWNSDQLSLITDENIKKEIKEKIYADYYDGEINTLRRYGLKTVGVPRDGNLYTLPQWIIEIIDYEEMTSKLLQSISDLLPSVGISRSKVAAGDYKYSNLISF